MPLRTTREVEKIHLVSEQAKGDWVDILAKFGKREQVRLKVMMGRDASMKRGETDAPDLEIPFGSLIERGNWAIYELAIVAWSFTQAITLENIQFMEDEDLELLEREFDERYEKRTEEESTDLSEAGPPPSSAAPAESRPSLPG